MTSFPSIIDNGSQGAMTLTEANLLLTSSAVSGTLTTLPTGFATTETAGITDTLYVTAYGLKAANTCGVITTYTGNKSLKFWSTYINPSTGTLQYSINGTSIATTQGAAASQTVSFASGATSVPILYRDVGLMQISAKDTAFPCVLCSGTYTATGSTANFVVKPAKFGISVIGNPGASTATGSVFTKAGQNFTTNVTAQDFAGNTTPNYGNETVAQSVNLTAATLVLPSGGHNGTITNGSAFTKTAPGVFQNTTVNYNEVGIIQLNAEVAGQNYLSAGNVTSTSGNVGRFTPNSFTLTNNTPQFATKCVSGSFTYLNQPFIYNTAPQLVATAKSADGTTTTQNYKGAFFKLTSGSIGASYTTNSVGTTLNTAATSISVADNANGSGTITFNSGTGLIFPKVNGGSIVPFTAEIKLAATVADTDSVTYASNPFNFGATTSSNGIAFSNTKQFYEGRMYINSVSGSELLPLSPNINLQYFTSGSVWATNTADNCTVFTDTSKLNLTYDKPGLTTTPTLGSISNGVIPLMLSAPGSGNVGNVSIEADISTTGANLPYLQYDWPYDGNSDGVANDNPRGIASFGVYQGKAFIVYQREVY
jgi:MSHA biogenesis protein MshQ